jgi:hypothetical protein
MAGPNNSGKAAQPIGAFFDISGSLMAYSLTMAYWVGSCIYKVIVALSLMDVINHFIFKKYDVPILDGCRTSGYTLLAL